MPQEYYSLSHSGIKGMKWGIRRWRNYDDTLTEAGKKRYGDGGVKAIRKAEKERRRREKIMSDPRKLYKHRHEFTAAELEAARARFDTQAKIREQANKQKMESLEQRLNRQLIKEKAKADLKEARSRGEMAEQKLKAARAEEERKAKISKSDEARKQREEDRKVESAKKEEEKKKWPDRAKKLASIFSASATAKTIFDELGVTDPKSGKTLFGSLGSALGFGDKKADDVVAASKAEQEKDGDGKKAKEPKEVVKDVVTNIVGDEKTAEVLEKKIADIFDADKDAPFRVRANASVDAAEEIRKGRMPKFEDIIDDRYKQSKEYKENRKAFENVLDIPIDQLTGLNLNAWTTPSEKKKKKK